MYEVWGEGGGTHTMGGGGGGGNTGHGTIYIYMCVSCLVAFASLIILHAVHDSRGNCCGFIDKLFVFLKSVTLAQS